MSIAFANKYWLWWFIILLTSFLVPEIWSLIRHTGGTLSETIWRLEDYRGIPQPMSKWNAFHFLFMGELLILDIWLFCHFIFYKFR